MKPALLCLALLVGCGPDRARVVDSFTYRGLTLSSELVFAEAVNEARVRADIDLAINTFASAGVLPAERFEPTFGRVEIILRAEQRLPYSAETLGAHHPDGHWVELARGGSALGHELMHVLGAASHDAAEMWSLPAYNEAQKAFYLDAGGWYAGP